MDRDSGEMERSTIPDSPDTERTDPLTPTPGSDSVDVSVDVESSGHRKTQRTWSDPGQSVTQTARSAGHSASPDRSTSPKHAASPKHGEEQSSHTTMQSMMRPDVKMSGVPHSRRFLSIENDLDQVSASLRLMEKGLISAQKEARIAWILATAAIVLAALAMAL